MVTTILMVNKIREQNKEQTSLKPNKIYDSWE
jgi:hypothetical protein